MHTHRRLCACLLVLAGTSSLCAAEKWVFFSEGWHALCLSVLEGDPAPGRLPDGGVIEFSKDMVQGTRTVEQVEQAVDAMIAEMVLGKSFEEHSARFKVFRASAVPALLKHLAKEPLNERLSALYGLCFSWSKAALEPVLKDVRDKNPQVSRAAYSALERNVPLIELGRYVKDLADDPDISKAVMVFRAADQVSPDPSLKRIRRLLANAEGRSAVAPYLSHYFELELVPEILELLASEKIEEQRSALLGLIATSASNDPTRERVAPLLRASDADLRQLAYEYFARCGTLRRRSQTARGVGGGAESLRQSRLRRSHSRDRFALRKIGETAGYFERALDGNEGLRFGCGETQSVSECAENGAGCKGLCESAAAFARMRFIRAASLVFRNHAAMARFNLPEKRHRAAA